MKITMVLPDVHSHIFLSDSTEHCLQTNTERHKHFGVTSPSDYCMLSLHIFLQGCAILHLFHHTAMQLLSSKAAKIAN